MTDARTAAITKLAEAGFPMEILTGEQLQVLASLSEPELALLIDLKAKMDEVEPEVQAHANVAGGSLF